MAPYFKASTRSGIAKTYAVIIAAIVAVAVVGVALYITSIPPAKPTPTPTPAPMPTPTPTPTPTPRFPLPHWPSELIIRGFSTGTAGYLLMSVVGSLIEEHLGVKTTVQPGVGLPNFVAVANGEVDIAMSYSLWAGMYIKGYYEEYGLPPANAKNVAYLLGATIPDYCALVIVYKDVPANTFAELIELIKKGAGKPIIPASARSVDEYIYRALFKKYGLDFDEFKIPRPGGGPAVEAFIEGKYDVILDASPRLSPQWQEINIRVPDKVKVIYFSEDYIDYLIKFYGPGAFVKDVLPKGLYKYITEDYPTVCSSQIIIVRADLPEDLVYHIARLLNEYRALITESVAAFAEYDPTRGFITGGLPFHPGAEKYYREKGYIK